ncbi:MAG TPA: TonB family protein [Pyrinomonadaceae bacterium]|nr:TonB family protein [Pyrinomonadaceae bacterium]
MDRVRTVFIAILLAALVIFPYEKVASSKGSGIQLPPRNGGVITGTISYAGDLPTPRLIDMSKDHLCESFKTGATTPDVVVSGGKLANAFVSISGLALEGRTFDPPSSPVVLEHKSCQLVPHVLGMQAGQMLSVINADATTHETNVYSFENEKWDASQRPGSPPLERRFTKPELFISVEDKQHPWEAAHLFILPHPFFSVSDTAGTYRITGVPPGRYTVAVSHEKFGKKIMEVLVSADESKAVDFTFAGIEVPASELTLVIPAHGMLHGGILNGKVLSRPDPVYPPRARAAGVTGLVTVEVLIDEGGNVVSARAVAGPLQLQPAAVKAAYQAKFPPTLVSDQPVKVTGVITYLFKLP